MKQLWIACSLRAYEKTERFFGVWKEKYPEDEITRIVKCESLPDISEKRRIGECVGEWFERVDAIVFFCAAGIAVRSIAPWIVSKKQDPAVIVMDESCAFAIPILSGHWGGANELTQRLCALTGATPVITTATDREQKFAADVFAQKNGLHLTDWKLAKRLSARLLEGKKAGFYSRLPLEGELPLELTPFLAQEEKTQPDMGVSVSIYQKDGNIFAETLLLVPRIVTVGIGCKKGTAKEKIASAIGQCLKENGICPEAVCAVASIDLKKEEQGILSYCETEKLPFLTYPAEVLRRAEGDFSGSGFVSAVTGVDNVCERSAVTAAAAMSEEKGGAGSAAALSGDRGSAEAAASGSMLLCKKSVFDGVTVALAVRKARVEF